MNKINDLCPLAQSRLYNANLFGDTDNNVIFGEFSEVAESLVEQRHFVTLYYFGVSIDDTPLDLYEVKHTMITNPNNMPCNIEEADFSVDQTLMSRLLTTDINEAIAEYIKRTRVVFADRTIE